ncbi:hypothetical protein BJX62DRAFT_197474 [Aspergillus germanicus]
MGQTWLHHLVQLQEANDESLMSSILALTYQDRAFVNATDQKGRSALHHAAKVGNESAVRVLLQYGADHLTADQGGYTPF